MFRTKTKRSTQMRGLMLRAVVIAGSLTALLIYLWGVELATVFELVLFLFLAVIALTIPAALFVGAMKLFSYVLQRIRGENS